LCGKLDRLARSLRDLVSMLDDFHRHGIHFRSITEEINTGTPGGKLIFHIFAASRNLNAASLSNAHGPG
jgi:DNA invertase Pin-like site-specific DNA recombinase